MFPGIDRLKMLKVRDVMSRNVIKISKDLTMSDAAVAFAQNDVYSAPVVDEQGRCVGMLSAADFIKRERPRNRDMGRPELTGRDSDDSSTNKLPGDMVSCYMSGAPRSVTADELLLHAARVMAAEHIHHLPVLKDERPIGVVSTMDIVAVLINAVNEVEAQSATPRRD
jgi:CBS domain-containing protein